MALDFGLLQPVNISGQLQAGQESAMRNQLAQQQLASSKQQMETGRLQQEKVGLELQDFKRRQSALDQFLAKAAEGGHTGDPEQVAQNFYEFAISNRDPQVLMAAQQALMAAKERKQYLSERMPGAAPAAAGAPAQGMAPMLDKQGNMLKPVTPEERAAQEQRYAQMAAGGGAQGMAPMLDSQGNLLKPVTPQDRAAQEQRYAQMADGTAGMPMPAVTGQPLNIVSRHEGVPQPLPAATNALAPPAPAAVNTLAAPADPATALQNKIIDLQLRYPSGAAKAEIGMLTKQLEAVQKLHVVGDSLLNGAGQVIATVPKKATLSEFERILENSGLTPDQQTQAKQAWLKKQTTHAPPVSVSMTQEKAESADYGKFLVKQFESVTKAADLAQKSMPALESNLSILNKGFDTGFGTETKAAGAKVLAALGVKDAEDYATNAQTFLANASAAVLQKQLEQKGPQTESDAQRITQTGAQLGNTKAANQFVLNVAKAQLQRDIDQRKFYSDWRKTNKSFDGADEAWNAGPGSKSLFENPALKSYKQSAADLIPGQGSAPALPPLPQAAVDALKAGKGTDAQFDAIFGAGAAKRARGAK